METNITSYQIFPLGDTALTIEYGNIIDEQINKEVIARAGLLKETLSDIIEVAPAYSSLTIYFDLLKLKKQSPKDKLVYDHLKEKVDKILQQPLLLQENQDRFIKIPVCYEPEFGTDIQAVATANNITVEEVVALHLSKTYRVYMLGFLPGFSYMGEVDEKISMPRKQQPQPVARGSVGIAGRQTGVYPFASPGGWQLIGRTPLSLFDAGAGDPALLRAGDNVQFFSITKNDFYEFRNSPLLPE